uniref:Uncharacterized protein n=1 Tax=Engystomops pustulosus TaxID=76066 RepID=A0AAV6YN22_ENGPU|nr:hypothetical protein GDO81_022307 [Engystomops pustulosus]
MITIPPPLSALFITIFLLSFNSFNAILSALVKLSFHLVFFICSKSLNTNRLNVSIHSFPPIGGGMKSDFSFNPVWPDVYSVVLFPLLMKYFFKLIFLTNLFISTKV